MKLSYQPVRSLAFVATLLSSAHGCSRVFQNKFDTMVAGRSMDWGWSFEDVLFLNPPSQEMDGGNVDLPAQWTSKYGSIVSSIIGFYAGYGNVAKEYGTGIKPGEGCEGLVYEKDGGADGVNTKGLSAHLLYLGHEDGTHYAEPSTTDAINISYMRWVRYVLDNFATVAEAVEGLSQMKAVGYTLCEGIDIEGKVGHELGGHMAIEDASGDSAIFEHVDGEWQVYHSSTNALVMTNEPPYNKQKEILSKYDPWGGDITLPDNLPGTVDSVDRMIRLEHYLQYTPEPANYAEAIANVRSLTSTTNVPFGAPYGVYPTWWNSFVDVNDQIYYYDWLLTPNMVWVELQNIDWDSLPETLTLKPQGIDLVGNVLCNFETLDGKDPMLEGCTKTFVMKMAKNLLRGARVVE